MQRVLSGDLWKTVRGLAKRASCRKAVIAYVTQDMVGFRKGDVLVVDASDHSIANGETDAKLLRRLSKKGVGLFHCVGLHAKVLLMDEVAVISSANMSRSSENALVEAGIITDHSSTVAGAASFVEQLVEQSTPLTPIEIERLCKIVVLRRGGMKERGSRRTKKIAPLGNRTWLIGLYQIEDPAEIEEKKKITHATEELRTELDDADLEPEWIRWTGKGRFIRECQKGDSLIQIWRERRAGRPTEVYRSTPVLLRQHTKKWTRFYSREPEGKLKSISWGQFKRLLKEVGFTKHVGPNSEILLDPDVADAIARRWRSAVK